MEIEDDQIDKVNVYIEDEVDSVGVEDLVETQEDEKKTGRDIIIADANVKIEDNTSKFEGNKHIKNTRKARSAVWNFFDKLPVKEDDKKQRSKCKQCGKIYISDSSYGTGNMKRHLLNCVRRNTTDVSQLLLSPQSGGILAPKFDQAFFDDLVTEAIVMHDLPFQFIEYEGVRKVLRYLRPDLKIYTRNTAKAHILKKYRTAKQQVKSILDKVPGRISLTSDLWTSIATDGYISLTAHFIDSEWVLRKIILNFSYMPPPHTGVALADKLYNILSDWEIESKVFSLTLDNASANDVSVEMLKSRLNIRHALLANGEYFHLRCCAHILNLVVQDGLKDIADVSHNVRESIKYIKGSQTRKKTFLECINLMSLDNKRGLRQDVPTRWNSTYLMLDGAIFYRRAFCHLQLSDSNYKYCPSAADWERVQKIRDFLAVFYDMTTLFSGTKYPTSNLYFPGASLILLTLQEGSKSSDFYVQSMATRMLEKFGKYWSDFVLILCIAIVLDPRYKLHFVEFCFKKLYPENYTAEVLKVRNKLDALFDEYMDKSPTMSSTTKSDANSSCSWRFGAASGLFTEFDSFESETIEVRNQKTQLEMYLEEPRVDRKEDFEILKFWKAEQYRYPLVAAMARDVLSIPVSTVASESAFSIGGRVLDQYRSTLKPDTVEALICARDWLFNLKETLQVSVDEITEDIVRVNVDDINSNLSKEMNN